jgi:hypothetical protein
MASYHCEVKVGAKGKAGPHSSYISREGKYAKSLSVEKLEQVEWGNMPSWAVSDPAQFWQAADQNERANGATYREIEVALPREMTPWQRVELVRDMVAQELGDKHAYTWAIHNPEAAIEGGEQPHAHIMYSERTIDGIDRDPEQYFKRYNAKNPEKGGCRKDSAGTEERLLATRERWANVQNLHLERYGYADRVDHRSLKDQGIDRTPEPHFGPGRVGRMKAKQDAELAAVLERRAAEAAKECADAELGETIIDLSGDLSAAKAERTRQDKQEEVRPLAIQDKDGLWREQAPGIVIPPGARVAQQGLDGKWRVVKSPPAPVTLKPEPVQPGRGINPLSSYHPDNIARRAREEQELALAVKIETERANREMVEAMERHAKRPHGPVEAVLDAAPTVPLEKPLRRPERPVEAVLDAAPTRSWEKPKRSVVELLKASLDVLTKWIKAKGMKHEEANVQQGEYIGAIVQADALHAVQDKGRGICIIHEQANLSHALKMDESNKEIHIKYKNGHGAVKGVVEVDTPDTPTRPRGPGR